MNGLDAASVEQDSFGEGGLAAIDVSADTEIAH